jgi:hypothetical protein
MKSLSENMEAFAELLLTPAAEPLNPSDFVESESEEDFNERLNIYRIDIQNRLAKALRVDFPVLRAQVGEENFAAWAAAYYLASPSTSYTLNDYGANFPAFLQAHPETFAFAADLARAEWCLCELVWRDAVLEAKSSGLKVNSSLCFRESFFNVLEILDGAPPRRCSDLQFFIFYKKEMGQGRASLLRWQYEALQKLHQGLSLEQAFSALAELLPEDLAPEQVQEIFKTWVLEEILAFEVHI